MVNDKFSWKHSLYKRKKSNINLYKKFINKFYTKKTITNYEEMWIWSVEKTEDFWRSIFEYYLKPLRSRYIHKLYLLYMTLE